MVKLTYKQQFNKKHKQPLSKSNSLKEISKLSGYQLKGIKVIFEKDLKTGDYKRAGYLSYYILWGDSTSRKINIDSYKRRFKLT